MCKLIKRAVVWMRKGRRGTKCKRRPRFREGLEGPKRAYRIDFRSAQRERERLKELFYGSESASAPAEGFLALDLPFAESPCSRDSRSLVIRLSSNNTTHIYFYTDARHCLYYIPLSPPHLYRFPLPNPSSILKLRSSAKASPHPSPNFRH